MAWSISRKCRNHPCLQTSTSEIIGAGKRKLILTSETLRANVIRRTLADVRDYTPTAVPTWQLTHSCSKQTKENLLENLLKSVRVCSSVQFSFTFMATLSGPAGTAQTSVPAHTGSTMSTGW